MNQKKGSQSYSHIMEERDYQIFNLDLIIIILMKFKPRQI